VNDPKNRYSSGEYQPGTHGIAEDVFGDSNRVLVRAPHTFEVSALPQLAACRALPVERRTLLEQSHELPEVSGVCETLR
jgi:hypothetical protein